MGESPRWHDGRFWMCDWLAGEVLVFDADGNREVVARVEGLPFSIDWLPDGRARHDDENGVVIGAGARAVRRPQGNRSTRSSSTRRAGVGGHARRDAVGEPQAGHRRRRAARRDSRQVADDVWFPNGMVVLGDDTLVLAESHADRLTAWTITDSASWSIGECGPTSDPGPRPTASAPTPTERSGTPAFPVNAAPASPRAARCSTPSRSTVAASPACSAATTVHAVHRRQPLRRQRRLRRHRAHPTSRRTPRRPTLTHCRRAHTALHPPNTRGTTGPACVASARDGRPASPIAHGAKGSPWARTLPRRWAASTGPAIAV